MKPVRGGKPPKESRTRGVRAVSAGALAQEVAKAFKVVDLFNLKTRNVEIVMTIYVSRARSVSVGENCRTRIIQPRCAIEE